MANRLAVGSTINPATTGRIESHFVSVKQEVDFLDENLCPEDAAGQNDSIECSILERNGRDNCMVSTIKNQDSIVVSLK